MYYLFAGEWYYPLGGYRDFQGAFETLEAAAIAAAPFDWAHIVHDGKIVWE